VGVVAIVNGIQMLYPCSHLDKYHLVFTRQRTLHVTSHSSKASGNASNFYKKSAHFKFRPEHTLY